MSFKTLEDESFVCGGFLFIKKGEVLIDLAIITLHFDGAELPGFSPSLLLKELFLVGLKPQISEGTESSFVVSDTLMHSIFLYRICNLNRSFDLN